MDDTVIVRVVDLPICIRGVTLPHEDGTYNIYVNAKYNIEQQQIIYEHEMCHIRHSDFNNSENIVTVECRAKKA